MLSEKTKGGELCPELTEWKDLYQKLVSSSNGGIRLCVNKSKRSRRYFCKRSIQVGILPEAGQPQQDEVLDTEGAGVHKMPDNDVTLSTWKEPRRTSLRKPKNQYSGHVWLLWCCGETKFRENGFSTFSKKFFLSCLYFLVKILHLISPLICASWETNHSLPLIEGFPA